MWIQFQTPMCFRMWIYWFRDHVLGQGNQLESHQHVRAHLLCAYLFHGSGTWIHLVELCYWWYTPIRKAKTQKERCARAWSRTKLQQHHITMNAFYITFCV
jgi:hypothetical protein